MNTGFVWQIVRPFRRHIPCNNVEHKLNQE